MCIIAVSPQNTAIPSFERREEMFWSNPDGAGFMYPYKGRVRIEKGFMTFNDMEQRLSEVSELIDTTKTPMVFHYRIGTHGGNIPQNTHPFPVTSNRHSLRALRIDTWLGCVHNGIIRTVKPRKGYSDTQEYIVRRLSHFRKNFTHDDRKLSVIELETGSRLAFLAPNGEITTVGNFIHDADGCLYSNSSYKPYLYNTITSNLCGDGLSWRSVYKYLLSSDESPEYNPETYKSTLKPLDGEIVIDGDGDVRDGAEFCTDQYGRLYAYNSDGTASLDSKARIVGRSTSPVAPWYDDWAYDEYDPEEWDDLTYVPSK